MTEAYTEDMLDETINALKGDDIENMKWLTTSPTARIVVETKGTEPPYDVVVHHPGIVRFMGDGSLVVAGKGLPFMVIAAGGWQDATIVIYEEENA